MKLKNTKLLLMAGLISLLAPLLTHANDAFSGEWVTVRELSTALDPFSRIELKIDVDGSEIILEELYSTGRRFNAETYKLDTKKKKNVVPITWWSANRHLGAYIGGDKTMTIMANWIDDGSTLQLESHFVLETSQDETPVRTYSEYRLSRGGERLTRLELRSTRPLPIVHVFERK